VTTLARFVATKATKTRRATKDTKGTKGTHFHGMSLGTDE